MTEDRVEIPAWDPPWPVRVSDPFIRVTAAHVRGDERWECGAQIAAKARPGVKPERDPSLRIAWPPHETFPLGIAREAAFAVLSRGMAPDAALAAAIDACRNPVPDAMRQVAQAALTGYLIAVERLRATAELPEDTVVREFFAVDEAVADSPRVEWSGWGLLHVSRDSAIREFHLLTWDDAGRRHRPEASLAVYARIAADAVARMDGQPWYVPWEPTPAQPRAGTTVRVREIGLLDSTDALLVDIPLDEARGTFPELVGDSLRILAGDDFNPGTRCATCAVRWECPAVPRLPGLLGVAGPSTWTRGLSPSDLTAGRVCTWQVHLQRDLSLPRVRRESTSAMRRGADIHSWLEHAHGRLVACTADDLPLPGEGLGEVAESQEWGRDQYAALRPYLLQHVEVCPLGRADVIAAYPEHSLTGWDTDVDVVMSTRTDLVVETPQGVVIRETKSVAEAAAPESLAEVFQRYPQVALALCLVADGLDPVSGRVLDEPRPARVELELLSTEGREVRSFASSDAAAVLQARASLADAVDLILYSEASPNPGPWCAYCPVSTWCVAAPDAVAREADDAGLESIVVADAPGRVALLAYSEALATDDDDIPF